MTDRNAKVEELLGRMDRQALPADRLAHQAARRTRVASAIDTRLEVLAEAAARGRRRRRWAWAVGAAAAVLSATLVLGTLTSRSRAVSAVATLQATAAVDLVRAGRDAKVGGSETVAIEAADELVTPEKSGARVMLASGASVDVGRSTTVRFEPLLHRATVVVEELWLSRGSVSLSVPKLGPGRTLTVRTPDSSVTVHGTRFRVEVQPDGTDRFTQVTVTEGSVWVSSRERKVLLRPGASWSSRIAAASTATPAPAATANSAPVVDPAPVASATVFARKKGDPADPSSGQPASTLALENATYHDAVLAARSGDDARALTRLDELLLQYPGSPLSQNAKVERFRALQRLGRRGDAAQAARRYLTEYPAGFARDEAKSIAVEALSGSP